ncbi:MAG: undecaprenyl diphosphate synthase [Bradymonadia bacterium]|jgi:undecaprenyl diphosphate synthase
MDALPRHIAIIMDGNGRWAQSRGLPRVEGHRAGAKTVNDVVRRCRELGVQALTLYAFSAQNWARPEDEVAALMALLANYVRDERLEILHNDIRLTTIGAIDTLPSFVRRPLDALCAESANNQGMTLALALSYGGREEILHGLRALATQVAEGRLRPDAIDASTFEASLYTRDLPPLDLLIRTSGEQRLSNFLLWQCAYAELYFSPVAWPDFSCAHLDEALATYAQRERRFGLTSAQIAEESSAC